MGGPFAFGVSDFLVSMEYLLVPPVMEPKRAGQDCRNRRAGRGCPYVGIPFDLLLVPYQISCVLQPAKSPTCAGPDQREGCDG